MRFPHFPLYFHDIIGFSRFGLRVIAGGIAKRDGSHAHQRIGQSPLFEQSLAFRQFEHLLAAMDPAGAEADGIGGVEQVSTYRGAIQFMSDAGFRLEYQQDRRRP